MLSLGSIPWLHPARRCRNAISFSRRSLSRTARGDSRVHAPRPRLRVLVYPDGKLIDARDSHLQNLPKDFEHILNDEPDYGGFLRGRVASLLDDQLIVVYCREEALAEPGKKLTQFLRVAAQLPVAVREDALVVSDNGDIYGTLNDLFERQATVSL